MLTEPYRNFEPIFPLPSSLPPPPPLGMGVLSLHFKKCHPLLISGSVFIFNALPPHLLSVVKLIVLFKYLFTDHLLLYPSSSNQLIQSDLDDDDDERLGLAGGRGTLRFKHKLPVELKGPEGVHVVHGSSGTLITSDLNSLPEDDQRALARSLEALNVDGALYAERNARTESAKSTPMHRHKEGDGLPESPLEITEL